MSILDMHIKTIKLLGISAGDGVNNFGKMVNFAQFMVKCNLQVDKFIAILINIIDHGNEEFHAWRNYMDMVKHTCMHAACNPTWHYVKARS